MPSPKLLLTEIQVRYSLLLLDIFLMVAMINSGHKRVICPNYITRT